MGREDYIRSLISIIRVTQTYKMMRMKTTTNIKIALLICEILYIVKNRNIHPHLRY